jgi:hypothetical protein
MTTNQYKIKVYKIWYEDSPNEFYIGSTKKKNLSSRMAGHRYHCIHGNNSKLYNCMREKGINNFKYVQIAWSNVSNIDEHRQIEQSYIDTLQPTLNTIRAYCSNECSKEHRKGHRKEFYQKNKCHRICICGSKYNCGDNSDSKQHYRTKKHQEYIKLIWERLITTTN